MSQAMLAERLVQQFYSWERRGRGWTVYPYPVRLEPVFEPFLGHFLPELNHVDDGRQPTLLSSLGDSLSSLFGGRKPVQRVPPAPEVEETVPDEVPDLSLVELAIALPRDASVDIKSFEQLLVCAGACRHPLAFELLAGEKSLSVQLMVEESDVSQIEQLLTSFLPEAIVMHGEGRLADLWQEAEDRSPLVVEFGLSHEFMLPFSTYRTQPTDPYVALVAAIGQVEKNEAAVFQVIMEPVRHAWASSIQRAVTAPDGRAFFDDAPEFLSRSKAKVAKPLFAAVVRLGVSSGSSRRTLDIARAVSASFAPFIDLAGNEFIPLSNDGYDDETHVDDLLHRRSRRSGMILNCEELASLVHIPGKDVKSAKFTHLKGRTKAAPASVLGHSLLLGTNTHNGRSTQVTMSQEQRVRHMHVIGASGTGKSTFLLNLIMQDLEQGQGIGVIDPHGDLIDQILERIPDSRIKDVVLVDPSDDQYPIGFNILSAHSDLEKNLLASDLVAVFRRFSTSWGDQMGSVLSNAILAFLESSRGGTLSDLRRFLIEPGYRTEFLTTVQDDHVLYYWTKEFKLLSGRPQAPLLTRLDTFLRPKPIRYMVSQKENRLNMAEIMDTGKIFLAKLAQGAIGEENASLLGSLFVSKFHQLTLGRQSQSEHSRRYFSLYCDEFGGYVTPSMAKLLSGARKFRLGLILSHQELQQLHDEDVKSALIANAGTRICFRLGDSDAKTLSEGFTSFEAQDLRNLSTGEAIGRVGRSEDDFNLTTEMTGAIPPDIAERRRDAIVTRTRETYGTKRELIEAVLARERGTETTTEVPAEPVAKKMLKAPAPEVLEPKREEIASSGIEELAETVVQKSQQQETISPVPESEPVEVIPPPIQKVPPKPKKLRAVPGEPAPMGKGGERHRYLQQFVTLMGQGLGYKVTIEMPTPDGRGSIDVVLERPDRRIACEIAVSPAIEHEFENLKKCLNAGFQEVVMLAIHVKTLKGLKETAEGKLNAKELAMVRFILVGDPVPADELLAVFGTSVGGRVAGYKVKVMRKTVNDVDADARKRVISKIMGKGA